MGQHLLSLFEITNANNLHFSYRLVDIDSAFESAGDDRDETERNRHLLRNKVGYGERVPVGLLRVNGTSVLAIPSHHTLNQDSYQLIPHDVRLRPRDEVVEVRGKPVTEIDRIVRDEFMRFSLGAPLRNRNDLWSATTTSYYSKSPVNQWDESRDVDVYRGFGYRVVEMDERLFIAVRLLHKYVDYRFIVDRRTREAIEELKRTRFLYLYGHRWFPVQLTSVLEKSISEQTFVPDNGGDPISVYDWTMRECPKVPWIEALAPNSLAITYKSVGNDKMRYGAIALCKRLMPNNDPTAKKVHKLSILNPHDRAVALCETVERFFKGATFNGMPVNMHDRLLRVKRRLFSIPKVRFGQDHVITVSQNGSHGINLSNLGQARMDALIGATGGVAVVGPALPQHLILPTSLDRSVGSLLRDRVEKAMQALLKTGYTIQQSVFDDMNCRTLRQQVHVIRDLVESEKLDGRGILVLPRSSHPRLHNYIKHDLKDRLRVQCIDAGQLGSYFLRTKSGMQLNPAMMGDFKSYIRYVSIGLLLASGHKPWLIDERLHYDASVALDVLKGTAAFTFMAEGGRVCFTKLYNAKGKERVSKGVVSQAITENVPALIQAMKGKRPDRFVLRRDGVCFNSEWNGMCHGFDQLGLKTELAAVEVHKMNSCGFRLLDDGGTKALNPEIGAWHAFSDSTGVICTTGEPYRLRGTANPLYCCVKFGDISIEDALEDIFWLSMLSWPVPDRYIRLPIDLKLCDDELSVVAAQIDDDDEQSDEESEETYPLQNQVNSGDYR